MPFEKLKDEDDEVKTGRACLHPEHDPPMHIVLKPGRYRYTCPACGDDRVVVVPNVRCSS